MAVEVVVQPGDVERGATLPGFAVSPTKPEVWMERLFLLFAAACAIYMLYYSQHRLLNFDELLSYYTESTPTVKALLHVQSTVPVSLDPPLYHVLGHLSLKLRLNPASCVRLPSLLGSILMMAGVYLFTRRLAGVYGAALSLSGLMVANNFHLVEARPYGILLGATAIALVLWQNAIRGKARTISILGLFLSLGLATSSHYFGILAAVPFLIVEAVRTLQRRRFDLPLAAALLGSYMFVAAWLPFLKAAHEYKSNYYTKVHFTDLLRAYTAPFDTALKIVSPFADGVIALAIVLLVACAIYRCMGQAPRLDSRRWEWELVFILALLPVFGVALAKAASGAFETRYVVEFSIGLSIALGCLVVSVVRSSAARSVILVACCLMVTQRFLSSARQNSANAAALQRYSQQIAGNPVTVMTDDEQFASLHYYLPGPASPVAKAIWVAGINQEIASAGTDNIDRTMLNLSHFTRLPVVDYDRFRDGPQNVQLVVSSATVPQNWIVATLRHEGAIFTRPAMDGNVSFYRVAVPAKTAQRK